MKINSKISYNIFILLFLFYFFLKVSAKESPILRNQKDTVNILNIKYGKKKTINISFANKIIFIKEKNKKTIEIPYSLPDEKVLPVNGLIVNKKAERYYVTKDNILLLPVIDVNNRMNLISIDLVNRKVIKLNKSEDYLISTNYWYYFDIPSKTIIALNNIFLNEKTQTFKYKIDRAGIIKKTGKKTMFDFSDKDDYLLFMEQLKPALN